MTRYGLIAAIVVALSAGSAYAQERDPFAPVVTLGDGKAASPAKRTVSEDTKGLDTGALSSYKLIGVIISKDKSFAVVRNSAMQDFFLQVGDTFGSEQGVVKEVNVESVLVELGDREILLPVKNRNDGPADAKAPQ